MTGKSATSLFSRRPPFPEVALPTLKKALDTFEKVAAESPEDSPQARTAALSVGRTLEARNELDRALKQYEKVATTKAWADSAEGREAARLAVLLKKPETITFYKELSAFKPAEATLPPGGTGSLNIPMPGLGGSGTSPISIPEFPLGKAAAPGAGMLPITLPDLSKLPPPPPVATPKTETPAAKTIELAPPVEPAPKPKEGDLPANVFTPGKSEGGATKK